MQCRIKKNSEPVLLNPCRTGKAAAQRHLHFNNASILPSVKVLFINIWVSKKPGALPNNKTENYIAAICTDYQI